MRKRCNRKIWSTAINPIAHAMAGASIVDDVALGKLRLGELSSLESMAKGLGTVQDWKTLVDMMNIAETMGRNGIGPEVLPHCLEAQKGLQEAARRYEKTGKMGLTGPTIQALREVHQYHDAQRTSISRSKYEQMIEKTRRILMNKPVNVVELV